ncbi:MAG: hypothetical protein KDD55_05280 [Bdellovibrionales bacterium]|nr:hypothetical protein [Bdellovibrionales bacterium]
MNVAHIFLIFFGAASLSLIAFGGAHWDDYIWDTAPLLLFFALPALLLLICAVLLLRKKHSEQINFILLLLSVGFSIFLFEVVLQFIQQPAWLLGGKDIRTHLEAVRDERKVDPLTVPSLNPTLFLNHPLEIEGKQVVPLSGISNVRTVFCNETGDGWESYRSDRFGFRNPDSAWDSKEPLTLILGDSYTHGFCMPDGFLYPDLIREKLPNTINLGINGNGPLLALASAREYASEHPVEHMIWSMYEGNDVEDLSQRINHPILKNYLLDPSYRQNLILFQPQLDREMKALVERVLSGHMELGALGSMTQASGGVRLALTLWKTRHLLGLSDLKREWKLHRFNEEVSSKQLLDSLKTILWGMKTFAQGKKATFTVVYIPAHRNFSHHISHPYRKDVMGLFQELEIDVVDLLPVLQGYDDPLSLYSLRRDGHFTKEGNALVAQKVLAHLKTLGA